MPTLPGMDLRAPSHWQVVDFISDLHLQAAEPVSFHAWQDYMGRTAADALFILGDLFEVWVGDDVLQDPHSFEHQCTDILRSTAQRIPVYMLHGNRDFLMGQSLMDACACTLLPDPTLLHTVSGRWLLSHGDELCLDDVDYQAFRRQVRSPQWQADFLAQPLAQRLDIARGLRARSEARKREEQEYADVDTAAALHWLKQYDAEHLIHGHTHKPGFHHLDAGCDRTVLTDWDLAAHPPRGEVLRLRCTDAPGPALRRLPLDATEISAARPAG